MHDVFFRHDCFRVSLTEYFSKEVRRRNRGVIVSPLATECDCPYSVFAIDSRRRLNSFNEGTKLNSGKKKIKKMKFFLAIQICTNGLHACVSTAGKYCDACAVHAAPSECIVVRSRCMRIR